MRSSTPDLLTADELLASPRGRSLVFGLAGRPVWETDPRCLAEGEPWSDADRRYIEFRQAAGEAQFCIDAQRGNSGVTYTSGSKRPLRLDRPEKQDLNALIAEVVETLGAIRPREPSQADLRGAMTEVIAGAMYWQPPHADALLAGCPAVRRALRPFAVALVDSGLLDSWPHSAVVRPQWVLAWDDEDHRNGLPAVFSVDPANGSELAGITRADMDAVDDAEPRATSADLLRHWLADSFADELRWRREFAKDPHRQVSGPWESVPPNDLWSSTGTWPDGTPVGLDLVEDDFGLERARACRLRINDDARIYEMHRPEDWAQLCRRFPLDVTAQRRHVWFETTGRKGRWVIPDWARVAEEFDGIHVSLAGYLRSAGTVVDVGDASLVEETPSLPTASNTDDRTASLMAGWNPDTTYWLNDVIAGVAEVVEWVYDNDADAWRQTPTG